MVVLKKKAFRLPRLEREVFVNLMRLGLDYNREQGTFSIKNFNNIDKILETLSSILDSEVAFTQTCTRCGKDFSCSDCGYGDLCTTKNLPFTCVCPQCLRDRRQFEQYLAKF